MDNYVQLFKKYAGAKGKRNGRYGSYTVKCFVEVCLCVFSSATNIYFGDLVLSDGFKLLNIILYVYNNSFHAHYFSNFSSSDFQ